MIDWIILIFISIALSALLNVSGKFIVEKHVKNPITIMIFSSLLTILVPLLLPLFYVVNFSNNLVSILLMLSGFLYFSGNLQFFYSLKKEDVSRVIIFVQLMPVFVLVLSTIFLNEILTGNMYIGFFLILGGSILVSVKDFSKVKITKALPNMLLGVLLWSVSIILLKYCLNFYTAFDAFFWTAVGYSSFGILSMFTFFKKDVIKTFKKLKLNIKSVIVGNEIIHAIASLISNFAISLGPVSIISVLYGFQPVFVLIYVALLSFFFPKILTEKFDKKEILMKISSIVLMILGLYFIYL